MSDVQPALAACRSDGLPTDLHRHPKVDGDVILVIHSLHSLVQVS